MAAAPALAQERIEVHEELDFDRPEAWGMQFAAAVTAFGSFGAPERRPRGQLSLGVEAASVPSLSEAERRIGFVGTKVEDIDRAPAVGRVRAAIGVGAGVTLELGAIPPVELDGLEPRFLAAAIARPLVERGRLRLAGRLGFQTGSLEGDITCSADDVAAGDDPVGNPFGCEAPSRDELELDDLTLELVASRAAAREGGLVPYLAVTAHRLDGTFQVDARYDGVVDRTRLTTAGTFWSFAAGGAATVGAAWHLAGEIFYAPLEIERPGHGVSREPVLSLRILVARRLR